MIIVRHVFIFQLISTYPPSMRMNYCHLKATAISWPAKVLVTPKEVFLRVSHGFTKRCRLSWLTNSTLVYEPKGGGGVGGGLRGQWVQLSTWSPNKLWRSNSIFNMGSSVTVSGQSAPPSLSFTSRNPPVRESANNELSELLSPPANSEQKRRRRLGKTANSFLS